MKLDFDTSENVLIATVKASRIDAASAIQFKDQFREGISGFDGRVIMDLGEVSFMDSSGLGATVAAMKLLEGRKLELACLQPAVDKVMTLTRMNTVFVIHKSLDQAKPQTPQADSDAA